MCIFMGFFLNKQRCNLIILKQLFTSGLTNILVNKNLDFVSGKLSFHKNCYCYPNQNQWGMLAFGRHDYLTTQMAEAFSIQN